MITGKTPSPTGTRDQSGSPKLPDPAVPAAETSSRRLYQCGGWAALAYLILVVTPMALLAVAPVPPSAVLAYISDHRVVYLAELVCFVGLSIPALVVFAAVAMALRHTDPALALLGGLFGVGSEIVALAVGSSPQSLNGGLLVLSHAYRSATTDQRAGLASAADAVVATTNAMPWAGVLTAAGILVLSLAMRSGAFPRSVAVFGVLTRGGWASWPRRSGR